MTEQDRNDRIQRAKAQQAAIRDARRTAQLARILWPQGAEDDLHGKVEVLTDALWRAGQDDAAQRIAVSAHSAAWRKHKRTQHVHDEGNVRLAQWWWKDENSVSLTLALVRQTLGLAERLGPTGTTMHMVDAVYWAAYDMANEVKSAQNGIPYTCAYKDGVLALFRSMGDWYDALMEGKDDLVAWADAHDHEITR